MFFTSSLQGKAKANTIINFTNRKLIDWYENAKEYNVVGSGRASYNEANDSIVINFIEDGKECTYEQEFWQDKEIDYTYNVWQEHDLES